METEEGACLGKGACLLAKEDDSSTCEMTSEDVCLADEGIWCEACSDLLETDMTDDIPEDKEVVCDLCMDTHPNPITGEPGQCLGKGACLLIEEDPEHPFNCEIDPEHFTSKEICAGDRGIWCEACSESSVGNWQRQRMVRNGQRNRKEKTIRKKPETDMKDDKPDEKTGKQRQRMVRNGQRNKKEKTTRKKPETDMEDIPDEKEVACDLCMDIHPNPITGEPGQCLGKGACLLIEEDPEHPFNCEIDPEHFTSKEICAGDKGIWCEACSDLPEPDMKDDKPDEKAGKQRQRMVRNGQRN